jgi:hypothetical protein
VVTETPGAVPFGLVLDQGGMVDAAASSDGGFLCAQTGAAGTVDAYRVNPDGSLPPVGPVTVPDAVGGEPLGVALPEEQAGIDLRS